MARASSGPIANRRQLGAELRRLRKAAKLDAAEAAQHLHCSMSRVSRLETGSAQAQATEEDVRMLCELYGVTDERQVEMLLGMLDEAQQRGWWESFEDVLPSGLEVFFGLEIDAMAERAWEPLLIHGLLQTADYARTIFRSWPTNLPHDIEPLVQARTERQKILTREDAPLELWLVLDEAAIRRPVGSPSVMREQLLHLVAMSELHTVTIQVVPLHKGGHPGLGGPFSILDFERGDPFVYCEGVAGNLYLEKRQDVRRFGSTFDLLRALALAPDESSALLKRAAEEFTQ